MGVDRLTKKMCDESSSPEGMMGDLERARTAFERYIETRNGSHLTSKYEVFERKVA